MNKYDKEMLAQIDLKLQQGQESIEDIEILLKRREQIINSEYIHEHIKPRTRPMVGKKHN